MADMMPDAGAMHSPSFVSFHVAPGEEGERRRSPARHQVTIVVVVVTRPLSVREKGNQIRCYGMSVAGSESETRDPEAGESAGATTNVRRGQKDGRKKRDMSLK